MHRFIQRVLLAILAVSLAVPAFAQSDIIARGIGVQARTSATVRFKAVPKLCFLGDSNTQFAINNSGTQLQNTDGTRVNWLAAYMGHRFYYDQSLNFGLASQKTDYWLATEVPAAIAAGCDIVESQIGYNDIATGTITLAQMLVNIKAGTAQLNAAGIAVVHESVFPSSTLNSAKQQTAAAFTRQLWLMSLDKSRNVRFVNLNPTFQDYSSGAALSTYTYNDNIHHAPIGGLVIAKAVAAVLDPLLPPAPEYGFFNANDTYDATLDQGGNIMLNGLMAGTGGSVAFTTGNPASGSVATSWIGGFASSTATTLVIVLSKGTNAANATIPTQILTMSGTADGNAGKLDQTVGSIPTGIAAGDKLYGECRLSWSNAANIKSLDVRLTIVGATTQEGMALQAYNPAGTVAVVIPAAFTSMSGGAATVTTPAVTVPASPTSIRMRVEVVPLTNAVTTSVTLTVESCGAFKAGFGPVSGL
jgi:hypothetical protein